MPGRFENGPIPDDDERVIFARDTFAVIAAESSDYVPVLSAEFLSTVSGLPESVFEPEDVLKGFVHHVLTAQIVLRSNKRVIAVAVRDAKVMHALLKGEDPLVVAATHLGDEHGDVKQAQFKNTIVEAPLRITSAFRRIPGYMPPEFRTMFNDHKRGVPNPIPYLRSLPLNRNDVRA